MIEGYKLNLFFLCLSTLVLLYMAGNAYYVAFKKYDEEDDFILEDSTIFSFFFGMLLLLIEKIFPQSIYMYVFKVCSFLFGSIMVGIVILVWVLFY